MSQITNNSPVAVSTRPSNRGFWLWAIVITIAIVVGSALIYRAMPPAQVYLRASAFNSSVEMFPRLASTIDDPVYSFADGTRCTVITDRDYYRVDSGPLMALYKLDCDGKVGYVHADRVSYY